MESYSVDEARAMSGADLVDRILAGEDIVITEGSVTKVRMEAVREKAPVRKPGRFKGQFTVDDAAFAPLTDEELKDWGL